MKLIAAIPLTLLFGTLAVGAQSKRPDQSQNKTVFVQVFPVMNFCPVWMRAQQSTGADRMLRAGEERTKEPGRGYHLTVANAGARRITGAAMKVRGLSGKARMTPILSSQDDADAVKMLTVRFEEQADGGASAELWVPGMSVVRTIALKSVTYADGTTWKVGAGIGCTVVPDGMMLVDMR